MPKTSTQERNDMARCFFAFLDKHDGDHAIMRDLRKFLQGNHDFSPAVDRMPMDEYEERLRLVCALTAVIEVKSSIAPTLRAAEFSAFMVAPLGRLRTMLRAGDVDSLPYDTALHVLTALHSTHNLLRVFLRGPGTMAPATSSLSDSTSPRPRKRARSGSNLRWTSRPGSGAPLDPSQLQARARSRAERQRAFVRDKGLCVITGTSYPQVCHIVPFSWTESQKNCDILKEVILIPKDVIWNDDDLPSEAWTALWREPGSCDKSWNMLSLNPLLHVWWARSFFGLEYLGRLPAEEDGDKAGAVIPVELRFRWLRRHPTARPDMVINFDDERDYANCFVSRLYDSPTDPATAERFVVSGQSVRTGHTICVRVPEPDADKFVAAVKVQWALTQIAAMCGFAETCDDDYDDDNPQAQRASEARVCEWLRDVPAAGDPSPRQPEPMPRNPEPAGPVERHGNVPKPSGRPGDQGKTRPGGPDPFGSPTRPDTGDGASGKQAERFPTVSPQRTTGARASASVGPENVPPSARKEEKTEE
ncbi:HNH endonuclease [Hirsutella rhossiliensis]|uniref:HNH endonuclease domain-containing protein n=1 Tax=Hirsutella rhossiliensis TaxID=111463 RepID=A0A9P8SKN5_9HYPO|nr:HNH endonuclease domain-containing protein [Hirsutella rhossiliensis]KAH0966588.1 HNH endonuclease domain-containing protein [Hirsutella rhossiliensis]